MKETTRHPYLEGLIDGKKNVALPEGFHQVMVWHEFDLKDLKKGLKKKMCFPSDFEELMLENTGIKIKWLEEIKTFPDIDNYGNTIPKTGGRLDTIFAISDDSLDKIAEVKTRLGMRYIDDVYFNHQHYLYPARIQQYCCAEEKELIFSLKLHK